VGFKIILFSILFILCVNLLLWFYLPVYILVPFFILSLILLSLIILFFRCPNRKPANISNNTIFGSADGVIVAIEEIEETKFNLGRCFQISTFMAPYNVHLNWIPICGTVEKINYFPGKKLIAKNPKSSLINEMNCVLIRSKNGQKLLIRQIAGMLARRIITFVDENTDYKCGDELGFIKFGSRVDIVVPINSEIKVKIGQKVKGMKSIIAELREV